MRLRTFGPVVTGVVLIALAGILVGVVLPSADANSRRPSARACAVHPGECQTDAVIGKTPAHLDPVDDRAAAAVNKDASWARGRDLYIQQGCYACHTQQVRPVLADVGLGPASTPGDYAFQDPAPAGATRVGPDLSNVGTRAPFTTCDGVKGYLQNPSSVHPWSPKASYSYLSDVDLSDLSTYLTRLRPAAAEGPNSCDPNESS